MEIRKVQEILIGRILELGLLITLPADGGIYQHRRI
jgi:hypothetical protein